MPKLTPREKRRCAAWWCTLVRNVPGGPLVWPTMADVAERLTDCEFRVTEAEVEDAIRWCMQRPRPDARHGLAQAPGAHPRPKVRRVAHVLPSCDGRGSLFAPEAVS